MTYVQTPRGRLDGRTLAVVRPGDPDWDEARSTFNLLDDQQPAMIAFPSSAADVAHVVDYARERDLRIAPQRTGHNAGPLPSLKDTILLKTSAMQGVEIDLGRRTARVQAGAMWMDLSDRASEHGLAGLAGSARDIGIVGYSLGGGMGWLARKHGLQASAVTAIELVTADGRVVRTDHEHEPELFWALRGGGGNFGIVTAIEFGLYETPEIYAGSLFFPFERASEALHAWREWTSTVPEEVTSSAKLLQMPDLPELPDMLRGRSFAVLQAAFLGGEADGVEIVKPLRALGADIDTYAMVPPAALGYLAMDPDAPMPYLGKHRLVSDLPAAAIDALLDVVGPGSGSTLNGVDLRHTGGALSRSAPHHGALATFPGEFLAFAAGGIFGPEMIPEVSERLTRFHDALAPWHAGYYLNFMEEETDPAGFYDEATYRRLQSVRAEYDGGGVFLANHSIAAGER